MKALKTGILLAGLCDLLAVQSWGAEDRRPNIILIMSDDHRADLMGCAGNPFIQTPNLDRLASEGLRMRNAFNPSKASCTPSRACFLTGKYAHRVGALRIVGQLNATRYGAKMMGEYFKEAGYRTGYIGKWHLGNGREPQRGFDYWAGFDFVGKHFNQPIWINGKETKFSGYTDDNLSDLAVKFIKEKAEQTAPFFLFLGLKSPHIDYAVNRFRWPHRFDSAYNGVTFPKPVDLNIYTNYPAAGKPVLQYAMFKINCWIGLPMYDNSFQKYIRSYYRSASSIDDQVGKVMKAVRQAGIEKDTILIYTTDQGYFLGEHGLTEKIYSYEEALRIPMLMRYPRLIAPGTVSDELGLSFDLLPTLLELAGIEVPEDLDGKSWVPLLKGKGRYPGGLRDHFAIENSGFDTGMSMRTKRYKLLSYGKMDKFDELYDLEKDPKELRNLVAVPEYKEVYRKLKKMIHQSEVDTDWRGVVSSPVTAAYAIGPFSAEEDQALRRDVLQAAEAGAFDQTTAAADRELHWEKITGARLDVSGALGCGKGSVCYLAIPVDSKTETDPVPFIWMVLDKNNNRIPIAAYHEGKLLFENKENAALTGNPPPFGILSNRVFDYNPPLRQGRNVVVWRLVMNGKPTRLKIMAYCLDGIVTLPLQ